MSQPTETLTTVQGDGVAVTDYDSVSFACVAQVQRPTSEAANKALTALMTNVDAALSQLKKQGLTIVNGTYAAKPSNAPSFVHDTNTGRRKRDGHVAQMRITFRTLNVALSSMIYNTLSVIDDDLQVNEPTFKVNNVVGLQKQALRDAILKVQDRFVDECLAFGVDPTDFAMASYSTRYDNSEAVGPKMSRGVMASSMYESASGGGVEIVSEKAVIRVGITVTFGKVGTGSLTGVVKAKNGAKSKSGKRGNLSVDTLGK